MLTFRQRARALCSINIVTAIILIGSAPATAHEAADASSQARHIERRARSQIDAPYSYGGGSPSGFDCSGFTRWVFGGHGADLPHSSTAQFELGTQRGNRRVWSRAALRVGDLVFHKTTSARVGHVGVYVGNGRFISSTSSEGVQVRSLDDSYWGPRWVGATRVGVVIEDSGSSPAEARLRHLARKAL